MHPGPFKQYSCGGLGAVTSNTGVTVIYSDSTYKPITTDLVLSRNTILRDGRSSRERQNLK
jgi:hypothetical protein